MQAVFSRPVEVRWSDLDPNFHLRHSVYYDYAAYLRVVMLNEIGLTPPVFMQHHFGLIIFREECIFKKEIHFGDQLEVNAVITKARKDFSRWTMKHEIWKNKNVLAAILTIEGAWLDTVKRKLYKPEAFLAEAFNKIPKHSDFQFEENVQV